MTKTTFTSDWFTHNEPTWDGYIRPYLFQLSEPKILEIGAFEGRSTLWFLDNFPAARVTSIDPWAYTDGANENTYELFMSNIKQYVHRITVMRGKSKIVRTFPENHFDMVYVDGDHHSASVIHDAVISFEVLKLGGLIVFDDYQGGDKSIKYPKPAIDLFHDAYVDRKKLQLVSDSYQRIYRKLAD